MSAGRFLGRFAKEILARGGLRLLLPSRAGNAHVLTFHGLIGGAPRYATENVRGKHIPAAAFRSLVVWLAKHYRIVPLDHVVAALAGGLGLPPNSVAITFDDGYESNYLLAYPILRELGIPATVFLSTAFVEERRPLWTCRVEYAVGRTERQKADIRLGGANVAGPLESDAQRLAFVQALKKELKALDQSRLDECCDLIEDRLGMRLDLDRSDEPCRRPLTWSQVAEMGQGGLFSFGGHTHRHVILGRCSEDRARAEVRMCHDILCARLGQGRRTFAYPNGKAGDFTEATHRIVREAGFSCALVTLEGPCVPGHTSPFGAPRLSVQGEDRPWSLVGRLLRRGPAPQTGKE